MNYKVSTQEKRDFQQEQYNSEKYIYFFLKYFFD